MSNRNVVPQMNAMNLMDSNETNERVFQEADARLLMNRIRKD